MKKYITNSTIKRFKVWLVKNNLSQSQFAKDCGVSRQYINRLLKKEFYITPKIIQMFSDRGFQIKDH